MPEMDHAISRAISHSGQSAGSRAISSIRVAIAAGPAIRGMASGTMKGSLTSTSSPKIPLGTGKIMRTAIRNRMIPPATPSDALRNLQKGARMNWPEKRKNTSAASAMNNSRRMIVCVFPPAHPAEQKKRRDIPDRVDHQKQQQCSRKDVHMDL